MTRQDGGIGAILVFGLFASILGAYVVYTLHQNIYSDINLVGGTYLKLDVDLDEGIKKELFDCLSTILEKVDDNGAQDESEQMSRIMIDEQNIGVGTIQCSSQECAFVILETGKALYPSLKISQKNTVLTFSTSQELREQMGQQAVHATIGILRNRLNSYSHGSATPILKHSARNIVVELPNVADVEHIKALIVTFGHFEMKPILDEAPTREQLLEKIGGSALPETQIIENTDKTDVFLVPNDAKITGRMLTSAGYAYNPNVNVGTSPHTVEFTFSSEGGRLFHELTHELTRGGVGGTIGIIIDNEVISAPRVYRPIDSSSGYISGQFTEEQAKEHAHCIRFTALGVPVSIVEERRIQPTLEAETIAQGLMACGIIFGALALFLFIVSNTAGVLFVFCGLLLSLWFVLS